MIDATDEPTEIRFTPKFKIGDKVRINDSLTTGIVVAHVVDGESVAYMVSTWSIGSSSCIRNLMSKHEIEIFNKKG